MRAILSIIFVLIFVVSSNAQNMEQPDVLGKILSEVGFTRKDIGIHPKGYWSRYPYDAPYRLSSFDPLLAEPLKLYDFARLMGNAAEKYLDPAYSDSNSNSLYKLVYALGVDKKLATHRSYSANLIPAPDSNEPLVAAFERLYRMAGTEIEKISFGSQAEGQTVRDEIRSKTEVLPDTVRVIFARLVVNLADVIKWRNLAFRNCDLDDIRKVTAIRDLASTQGDGQVYYPELDDIAKTIDFPSLHYAGLKLAAIAEETEIALKPFAKKIPEDFECEINTPYGKVAIFSPVYDRDRLPQRFFAGIRGRRADWMRYDCTNTLCVIDFGRNSVWQGTVGAAVTLGNPVSLLIDLGGDDYYGIEEEDNPPTTGVGLCGVGLVLDSKGDDHYYGSTYAQGVGLFGIGVLYDKEGNDKYKAGESAQGAGYFGIGLCFDGTGNDEFYLYGDGQGMGGIGGGVGVLASFSGDDKYTAEPYSKIFNRGDYHSKQVINGNNAQGAGFGRRGDGSDGHSYAGGLGAIIDIHGNDEYYSGNWTLGVGYWFGTGIAYDKNGDDHYKSCYFTQGSGAHYCNGILIDENGDDYHELFETAGAAFGFGWDFTNALLINKNGNDRYTAKMISYGLAEIRSNAFFIDIGGDDEYLFQQNARGIGGATWRSDFEKPQQLYAYNSYAKSFGGFIDIGGVDKYLSFDSTGQTNEHPLAKNNSRWLQPARSDSTFGANNYGVGIDIEAGTIPELFKWE